MAREMTLKQRKFVELYEGNATEAAIKAGYPKKTARSIGAENLTKPYIVDAIQKRLEKEIRPDIANRQERESFLTQVMRSKNEESGVRIDACDKLNKMNGDYVTKVDVTGKIEHIVLIDSAQSYEEWKKEKNGRV